MTRLAVIGLGYVGLPLAIEFARKGYEVVGFDQNYERITSLSNGHDKNNEYNSDSLLVANLQYSNSVEDISGASVYIVAVPTPVDKALKPDVSMLMEAALEISQVIRKGDLVVLESTVYPGLTRNLFAPALESNSGLVCGRDFFLGYSPERVNPGDHLRTLSQIVKVVAGYCEESTRQVTQLYSSIIDAGVFVADSLEVAEAAKVIENVQRDINIALMNEFSQIFKKLGISTHSVLSAAQTKWNFLAFSPGLVGGHCIGVDPYYLAERAIDVGHQPNLILAGRSVNESMVQHVIDGICSAIDNAFNSVDSKIRILVMGITFKENCVDIRNSKNLELAIELGHRGFCVDIFEPLPVDLPKTMPRELIRFRNLGDLPFKQFNVVVLAVPHDQIIENEQFNPFNYLVKDGIFADLKGKCPKFRSDFTL